MNDNIDKQHIRNSELSGKADNKWYYWALATVFAAGLALRLYGLAGRGFWLDELHALFILRHGFLKVIKVLMVVRDVPPLYYLFHVPFVPGVLSEPVRSGIPPECLFRLPEIICGALTVPATAALARKMGSSKSVSVFAALLMAVSPLAVYYTQEARPYAFVLLVSILSHLSLIGLIQERNKKWFAAYILTSAAGVHFHYFFVIAIAAQAAFVTGFIIAKRRTGEARTLLKLFCPAFISIALLSAPLLFIAFSARSGGGSGGVILFNRFYIDRVFAAFSSGWESTAGLITGWHRARYVFIFLFLAGMANMLRRRLIGGWAALVGFVFAVVLANRLLAAIGGYFSIKYIIYALPLFLILVAEGVFALCRPLGKKAALVGSILAGAITVALLVYPLTAYYRTQIIYDGHGIENWKGLIRIISEENKNADTPPAVFCYHDYASIPLTEYGCPGEITALGHSDSGGRGGVMERMQKALDKKIVNIAYFSTGDEIIFPATPAKMVWLVLFKTDEGSREVAALRNRFENSAREIINKDFDGQIRLIGYKVNGRDKPSGTSVNLRP